uniref:Uncharacterized protein C1orf112 homolog n=1 Tax=Phallusia mammillata TaxID=59560 RepID=A0A6F9D8L2_9ASCI|nr:uncharacterized protein C1orf112 homolog [Phallusia mammillata]
MSQASQSSLLTIKTLKKQVLKFTTEQQCGETNALDGFTQDIYQLVNTFQFDHNLENTTAFAQNVVGTLEMLFTNLLERIINSLQIEKKVDLLILQNIVENVSLLILFYQKLFKHLNESQSKMNMQIVKASHPVFGILHSSYRHCKNSQNLYGENFVMAAKVLKEWFEKTFALQKLIGTALMQIEVDDNVQSRDAVVTTSEKLFDICEIVNGLDNMLLVTSWKLLISFLSKCKVVLHSNFNCILYVTSLTQCIQDFVHNMVTTCNENKDQLKAVFVDSPQFKQLSNSSKLALYLTSLLPSFYSDYGLEKMDDTVKSLIQFILDVINMTTPYILENDLQDCVKDIFSVNLLDSLSKCLNAVRSSEVLQNIVLCEESVKPFTMMIISLKLCVLISSSPNKSTNIWYSGKPKSLVSVMFDLLPQVHDELFKCDSIHLGGCQRRMSLYEAVVSHMCAFVSSFPTNALNHLENVLLTNATSSHPHRTLLANDVWCFLASKSIEVGYHYVKTLIKWLSSKQSRRNDKFGYTLQRLFSMLLPVYKTELVFTIPFTKENLTVWRYLGGMLVASSPKPSSVLLNVCEKVKDVIDDWFSHEGIASQLTSMASHILVVENIVHGNFSKMSDIQKDSSVLSALSSLSMCFMHLLLSLPISCEFEDQLVMLYSSLVHCLAHLLPVCNDNISVQKILPRCLKIVNTNTWNPSNVSIFWYRLVELCGALKSSTLSADNQNTLVLLWKRLLLVSEKNWHLRFTTLNAFEKFSRVTKYPQLVARVCANDVTQSSWKSDDVEDVGSLVKAHLQRTVVSLSSNLTTSDVVAMNGKALLEADNMERSACKDQLNQVQKLITDIARNAEDLSKYNSEDLSPNDAESLRKSVSYFTAMLPNR